MKRFRGGLVSKAHSLLYHSTLGLRVIKKKKRALSQFLRAFQFGGPGLFDDVMKIAGGSGLGRYQVVVHAEPGGGLRRGEAVRGYEAHSEEQPRQEQPFFAVHHLHAAISARVRRWVRVVRMALPYAVPYGDRQYPYPDSFPPSSEPPASGRFWRMRQNMFIGYRGTSLIRNTHPPRITIGPSA